MAGNTSSWSYLEFEKLLQKEPHVSAMAAMTSEEKKNYIKKLKDDFITHSLKELELKVRVVKGENLIAKDKDGLSDPYCEVIFRNKKYKTNTVPNTLNPAWNETFEIGAVLSEDVITVHCWDKNLISSRDFEGGCKIALSENFEPGVHKKIYSLESREGKKDKVSGNIEIELILIDKSAPITTIEERRKTRRQPTFIKQGHKEKPEIKIEIKTELKTDNFKKPKKLKDAKMLGSSDGQLYISSDELRKKDTSKQKEKKLTTEEKNKRT